MLDAYERVRPGHPDAGLLLAPRHPDRFDGRGGASSQAAGSPLVRYSAVDGDSAGAVRRAVVLARRRRAARALLRARARGVRRRQPRAGRRAQRARARARRAARPRRPAHRERAPTPSSACWPAAGRMRVEPADSLAWALADLLDEPARAADMGRRARALLETGQGAVERHLKIIAARLTSGPLRARCRRLGARPSTSKPCAAGVGRRAGAPTARCARRSCRRRAPTAPSPRSATGSTMRGWLAADARARARVQRRQPRRRRHRQDADRALARGDAGGARPAGRRSWRAATASGAAGWWWSARRACRSSSAADGGDEAMLLARRFAGPVDHRRATRRGGGVRLRALRRRHDRPRRRLPAPRPGARRGPRAARRSRRCRALLPAGPLREPRAALDRARALLVVDRPRAVATAPGPPLFRARLVPTALVSAAAEPWALEPLAVLGAARSSRWRAWRGRSASPPRSPPPARASSACSASRTITPTRRTTWRRSARRRTRAPWSRPRRTW